jgi:hypothetical protein
MFADRKSRTGVARMQSVLRMRKAGRQEKAERILSCLPAFLILAFRAVQSAVRHSAALPGALAWILRTTKSLNQSVKRSVERFPRGFAFPLAQQQLTDLMSQIVTSKGGRGGHRGRHSFSHERRSVDYISQVPARHCIRVSADERHSANVNRCRPKTVVNQGCVLRFISDKAVCQPTKGGPCVSWHSEWNRG